MTYFHVSSHAFFLFLNETYFQVTSKCGLFVDSVNYKIFVIKFDSVMHGLSAKEVCFGIILNLWTGWLRIIIQLIRHPSTPLAYVPSDSLFFVFRLASFVLLYYRFIFSPFMPVMVMRKERMRFGFECGADCDCSSVSFTTDYFA